MPEMTTRCSVCGKPITAHFVAMGRNKKEMYTGIGFSSEGKPLCHECHLESIKGDKGLIEMLCVAIDYALRDKKTYEKKIIKKHDDLTMLHEMAKHARGKRKGTIQMQISSAEGMIRLWESSIRECDNFIKMWKEWCQH